MTRHKWVLHALLLIPFVVISLLGMAHHEPQRDDVQDYLANIENTSFADLYYYARYQSSPGILIYLLIRPFLFLSHSFSMLAIISWFIAFAMAALFVFKSPFSNWEKLAIILGYYFLYEYAISAGRPYGLNAALIFAACALYRQREKHRFWLCLCIGLQATTSMPGVVSCAIFLAYYVWDELQEARIPYAALLAGVMLAYGLHYHLPPPLADANPLLQNITLPDFSLAYLRFNGILQRVLLPVQSAEQFYFPHVTVDLPIYPGVLTVLYLIAIVAVLPRRKLPLLFFCASALVFMSLLLVHPGGVRHQSILWVMLLAAIWLDRLKASEAPWFTWAVIHGRRWPRACWAMLLSMQVWSGGNAIWIEDHYPNSLGRETAAFLKTELEAIPPQRALLATFFSVLMTPIVMDLPEDVRLYSLELERYYRYIPQSSEWVKLEPIGNPQLYSWDVIERRLVQQIQNGQYDCAYLIMPFALDITPSPDLKMRLVYSPSTDRVISMDEQYFIYRLL